MMISMKQVLIVEADTLLGEVLAELFRYWGFEVDLQRSVADAFNQPHVHPLDLVVFSSHSFHMTAKDLDCLFHEMGMYPEARVILLTTRNLTGAEIRALPSQCTWLRLPFSAEHLAELIPQQSSTETLL